MTATVRVYYHSSVTTAPVDAASGRYSTDSVPLLKQPYLGREVLSATTSGEVRTAGAPAGTRLARIQVQEGKTATFEVDPGINRAQEADDLSPTISGEQIVECGPGWKFGFKEYVVA